MNFKLLPTLLPTGTEKNKGILDRDMGHGKEPRTYKLTIRRRATLSQFLFLQLDLLRLTKLGRNVLSAIFNLPTSLE
jgi:hypothetical protein